MSDHTITWIHGDGEGVDASVTCTASEGAPCRLSCPAGCETWWLTGHEHGLEVVPCLAVEWWAQHMSTVECGPTNSVGEPVRNGPVDIEWDGDDWLWEYADQPTPPARPKVICLCGSTRFRAEMAEVNRQLTMDGHIVVAPGVFQHDGDPLTEAEKERLDGLHLRKIDLADEVHVVAPGGYVGDSTKREMAYAYAAGKLAVIHCPLPDDPTYQWPYLLGTTGPDFDTTGATP